MTLEYISKGSSYCVLRIYCILYFVCTFCILYARDLSVRECIFLLMCVLNQCAKMDVFEIVRLSDRLEFVLCFTNLLYFVFCMSILYFVCS